MFNDESILKKTLTGSLLSLALSLGSSIILIVLCALFLSFHSDPVPYIYPASIAVLYVSSIAGGVLSRHMTENIIAPLIPGCVHLLLSLITSLIMPGASQIGVFPLITAYSCIPLAYFIGGILYNLLFSGRPQRGKRKRRR